METNQPKEKEEVREQEIKKEEEEAKKRVGEVHLPGLSIAVGGCGATEQFPHQLSLPPLPQLPLQSSQLQPPLPQMPPLTFPRQTNNRIAELKGGSPSALPTDFSPLLRPGAERALSGLLQEKLQPSRSLLGQTESSSLEMTPMKKSRLDEITPDRQWLQPTCPSVGAPSLCESNGLRASQQLFPLQSFISAGGITQRPQMAAQAVSPFQWNLGDKTLQPGTLSTLVDQQLHRDRPFPDESEDDGEDTSEDEFARKKRDSEIAERMRKKTKRAPKPPPVKDEDSDSEKTEIDETVQDRGNENADKEHGRGGRRSHSKSTTVSLDGSASGSRRQSDKGTMKKGPWTKEEDDALLDWVEKQGAHDWSLIAEHIEGRVGKQCRERYFNHLAPDVRKDAWLPEEDDKIIHFHHLVGNKWTNISHMLGNGRSPNAIKNRWHSSLKNKLLRHGGEASIAERTNASHSCECKCTACPCACSVSCVALGCRCCQQQHWDGQQGP